MGDVRGLRMLRRLIAICLLSAVTAWPANGQTGKDYNPIPPPMPSPTQRGPSFDEAKKDAEERDRLRPKAIAPRTRAEGPLPLLPHTGTPR